MKTIATQYIQELADLLTNTQVTDDQNSTVLLDDATAQVAQQLDAARKANRKVIVVGNGGSATIASHIHTDLSHALGMRALVFYDQGLLTARSNDVSYETAFEWSSNIWADEGDIIIGISSSGQSQNIVRVANLGKARNCFVITLSGFKPENPLRQAGHLNFYVESNFYGYVEMAHAVLGHFITDSVLMAIRNQEKAFA